MVWRRARTAWPAARGPVRRDVRGRLSSRCVPPGAPGAAGRRGRCDSTRRRAVPSAVGVMLNSRTPSPISSASIVGCEASSPHTETGTPWRAARRGSRRSSRNSAGVHAADQRGQALIGPIGGEQVLHEVVGADGQEVRHRRQVVGRQRGGRHFDHRAQRHTRRPQALVGQRAPRLSEARATNCISKGAVTNGTRTRTVPPVVGGAEDGAQLRVEQGRLAHAKSNAAQAEHAMAIEFRSAIHRGASAGGLPLVEIERADRDRPRRHRQDRASVDLGLRALAVRTGEARQALAVEQQLRAEQADAVGVFPPRRPRRLRRGRRWPRAGSGCRRSSAPARAARPGGGARRAGWRGGAVRRPRPPSAR